MTSVDPPECPICLEQYTSTTTIPRVLPCGHSTCDTCLTQLHTLSTQHATRVSPGNTVHCPVCTHLVPLPRPSSLPVNYDLLRFSPNSPRKGGDPGGSVGRRFGVGVDLWGSGVYEEWRDWVIPTDVVLIDDHVVHREEAGLFDDAVLTSKPKLVEDTDLSDDHVVGRNTSGSSKPELVEDVGFSDDYMVEGDISKPELVEDACFSDDYVLGRNTSKPKLVEVVVLSDDHVVGRDAGNPKIAEAGGLSNDHVVGRNISKATMVDGVVLSEDSVIGRNVSNPNASTSQENISPVRCGFNLGPEVADEKVESAVLNETDEFVVGRNPRDLSDPRDPKAHAVLSVASNPNDHAVLSDDSAVGSSLSNPHNSKDNTLLSNDRVVGRNLSNPNDSGNPNDHACLSDDLVEAGFRDDCVVGRISLGTEIEVMNEITRCRLVDGMKVRLLELGRFGLSESFFEYSYVNKVMSVLSCMSDGERSGLRSVLRASVRVSRVCRVLGLWLDDEIGCLYLVSEKLNDGLLRLNVRDYDCRTLIGTIGVELCEALISLHREGFMCGCLGLSCVCFDEFGRVHVDLSEILVKGRLIHKCVVKGPRGRRKPESNGSEGENLIGNLSKMDVFVSSEVILEFLSRESILVEKDFLSCAVCIGSDVWLFASVLLRLVIGNEFVEGIYNNYVKATLDGTSEGVSKRSIMYNECVDKVNTSFETIMGSDLALLQEILVKCLDYAPENRPSLTDVWKNIKALNNCQYNVASLNMAPMKEDIKDQCLALNELCISPSSVRNKSSTSNLNNECDDGVVDPSQADEVSVDDFVERLAAGKLLCKDLEGHRDCITGFCAGGEFLFSSSFDKTVKVWSLQDFTHVHTFEGHEHRVMAVVFIDQEKPLCISADNGGGIFLWEAIQPFSQKPLKKWYEEQDWRYSGIHALAFSDSGYLYTGSGDRLIKAWSLRDHTLLCSMEGHRSVVSSLALSNGVLYSGSWDGTVRLWCLHDHSPLAVFADDTSGIVSSVHSLYAEQNVVIAAYEKGHMKIWMNDVLKSSKHIHNGAALALAMEESWLFSGGWDRTVKVQEIKRAGAETDIRDIGSIACDSVVTALMYVQGTLFVGYANRLIKVFHCRS